LDLILRYGADILLIGVVELHFARNFHSRLFITEAGKYLVKRNNWLYIQILMNNTVMPEFYRNFVYRNWLSPAHCVVGNFVEFECLARYWDSFELCAVRWLRAVW